MTRQGYIRSQKIRQNRLMTMYVGPVYDALMSQVQPYIAMVRHQGVEMAYQTSKHGHALNTQIADVIKSLYKSAAEMSAPKTRISKGAGFGINWGFVKDVLAYFAEYLFEKVVLPISQTTLDDIEETLQEAIQQGWGVERTVSELENNTITKARARTIVRTESVRAMNYSQMSAADDANYEVQKQWIAIEDQRTRIAHGHAGLDGQIVDLYDTFDSIFGPIGFPGDPEAPPENTINCRCTLGYSYKRDLNGRLIPKTPAVQNISL